MSAVLAFDENLMPTQIAELFRITYGFNTIVITKSDSPAAVGTSDVIEQRVPMQQNRRTEAELVNLSMSLTTGKSVIDFYTGHFGRASGFRFTDPLDNQCINEILVATNGQTVLQATKNYGTAPFNLSRKIKKLQAGTITLKKNGVAMVVTTTYTVDITTGLFTLVVAANGTDVYTVSCSFDVPMRFAEDRASFEIDSPGWIRSSGIKLIEIV